MARRMVSTTIYLLPEQVEQLQAIQERFLKKTGLKMAQAEMIRKSIDLGLAHFKKELA